jgi:hypothetical protein
VFIAVEASLSRTKVDIGRLTHFADRSDLVKSQIEVFDRQSAVIVRPRDVEPQLPLCPVYGLTETAIQNAASAHEQRLKFITRALFGETAKNRLAALRCLTRLLIELSDHNLCRMLCEPVSERIVGLCNDSDNCVASAALEALVIQSENGNLGGIWCTHAISLLCDDSSSIRASAAKFIARHYFTGENAAAENLLKVGSIVRPDDLPGVVASLDQSVKATRKWSQICELKKEENDESIVRLLCKIVLF